jgi:hypothetical protein
MPIAFILNKLLKLLWKLYTPGGAGLQLCDLPGREGRRERG